MYVLKFFCILVNSVAWAPHELGAILSCASSDGKISIHEYKGKSSIYIYN